MTITLTQLTDFKQKVYRNITGEPTFDEFDDLTSDKKALAYAHKLTNELIRYHAIDYLFQLSEWNASRFGNGSYPVWYGTLQLQTSFYETLYHWHRTFILSPQGFSELAIKAYRTVFTVSCHAALVDLRNQCTEKSELINPDVSSYPITQTVGERMVQEGYPGLITKSARDNSGEIIAVFNKKILSDAGQYGNYSYEFDPASLMLHVRNSDKLSVLTIPAN